MRQRLGLAHALLGDPEVLILDEPANGLDPEGIRWMRGLLRDFADRGGTVLLSSHLLIEVEAVADRLLIIGNGRIVADGSREELLAGTGVLVRATDAEALAAALRAADLELPARRRRRFVVDADAEAVGLAALAGGVVLTHLGPSEGAGLETTLLRPHRGARMTVSFPRLTLVELRKMVDTRAGFWLQLIVAAAHARGACSFCIFADTEDLIFRELFASRSLPGAVLLPIIGILLVELGVVAADGADHVHARAEADAGDGREDRGRPRAGRDRAGDRAGRRRDRDAVVGGEWKMGAASSARSPAGC